MIRKFDNFLIGLLWLLSVVLATTFWMNINYGFNILSAAHWAYLSELQASRTQIKFDFYVSLIVAFVIGLVGLYILVRPRFRKLPIAQPEMNLHPRESVEQKFETPIQESRTEPEPQIQAPVIAPVRPISPSGVAYKKPNIAPIYTPPVKNVVPPIQSIQKPNDNSEIQKIFESGDYVVKPCKKIGKIIGPVVALGYDNTVWISALDVSVDDMRDAIQTMIAVFDDTLGDTASDLSVRGCVINTSEQSDNPDLISTFKNTDEFKSFISGTPNEKPEDFDASLFDAISTYISTVTNYIGKE